MSMRVIAYFSASYMAGVYNSCMAMTYIAIATIQAVLLILYTQSVMYMHGNLVVIIVVHRFSCLFTSLTCNEK